MKIVVTVKQVPDTNAEKTFDASTKRLNRTTIENVLNPFDEYAIEEALRLKEQLGADTTVTILTMAPESGREVTKFSSSHANVDQIDLRWWFDEVDEDGQVTRWQRATTLHYLYRREAELLFAAAGFDLDALHGDYDGSPAGGASPKLLVVARRRERGAGRERRG